MSNLWSVCNLWSSNFRKTKSQNEVDDITSQRDLSRLSWEVQEMVGADFFHVKLGW